MAATPEVAPALRVGRPEAPYTKLSPGPGRPATEVAAHQRARIHGAMVEIVAERGYDAVTVRELARRAGVSTRAFYEHFSGKEECFLRAHELTVRRVAKRIVISQAGERDWRERLRLAFGTFDRELERDPRAARLALVEAYAAGPAGLEQIRRAECTFEEMLREGFARAEDGIVMPPLLVEGMVGGIAGVVGTRLVSGRTDELPEIGDALMEWVLCYRSNALDELAMLDRQATLNGGAEPAVTGWPENGDIQTSLDDRTLILAAVAKLAALEGYGCLTIPRIRAAAGVSRRSFEAHFSSVEACFFEALEALAGEAFVQATQAQATVPTWEDSVYPAVHSLCTQISRDPLLAKLCFVEVFSPGVEGMLCRERAMAHLADLVGATTPPLPQSLSSLSTEASAGAIWAVMHHQVAGGRAQQLPRIAATLSFLALAPRVGPQAAIAAIHRSQAR